MRTHKSRTAAPELDRTVLPHDCRIGEPMRNRVANLSHNDLEGIAGPETQPRPRLLSVSL